MEKIFLRTEFNYDTNKASRESGLECKEETMTKQAFAEECDINTIVRRFGLTGQLPENVRAPTYGDFTEIPNFHAAMNSIVMAREAFDKMPADIRYRFANDPGRFVDFCSDDRNRAEAEKLGLVYPKTENNPTETPLKGKETPKTGEVSPSPVTTSKELGKVP
ncbi:MAG: internal scaffolding protein [Microviridae sp.]|nr:MAG: internal scaffolding protein [Microviridae sp.]